MCHSSLCHLYLYEYQKHMIKILHNILEKKKDSSTALTFFYLRQVNAL